MPPSGSPAYLIARRLDVDATFGQSRLHSDEKGPLKGVVSGQQTGAGCLHWGTEKKDTRMGLKSLQGPSQLLLRCNPRVH